MGQSPILLLGTAGMGRAYAQVLRERHGRSFAVLARDPARTRAFAAEVGAAAALPAAAIGPESLAPFGAAIVATAPESLDALTGRLIDAGIPAVLVEKPAALDAAACRRLAASARARGTVVRVALNRRFFGAVRHLEACLDDDPPLAARFDFTERSERVAASGRAPEVLGRWAIANSVHVFDTVRHLLGPFDGIRAITGGAGALPWHPAAATFTGSAWAGHTPVAWATSWLAPGRWGIEVLARGGRYLLAPMEELRRQAPGAPDFAPVPEAVDQDDLRFKPGLARMVGAFLDLAAGRPAAEARRLPTLDEHADLLEAIATIAGYPRCDAS